MNRAITNTLCVAGTHPQFSVDKVVGIGHKVYPEDARLRVVLLLLQHSKRLHVRMAGLDDEEMRRRIEKPKDRNLYLIQESLHCQRYI